MVQAGELGDVRLVTGHYFQDWLLFDTDWNWRLEGDQGGALRAVGDIGSHWLDLTSFVTGLRVEAVMADLTTFIPVRHKPAGPVLTFSTERAAETIPVEIRTEDAASTAPSLRGRRPRLGQHQPAQPRPQEQPRLPDRRLLLRRRVGLGAAGSLWIGHRDRPNELLLRNPALMNADGVAAARLPGGHVEGFADTFGAVFSAVYADVLAGRPSEHPRYATFADGHEEMLIGDAVLESSRSGRWVQVART